MSLLAQLLERGGPVMYVIIALSVLLYTQCAKVLLCAYRAHLPPRRDHAPTPEEMDRLAAQQDDLRADFHHRRLLIGSMIAAAPLLGLLGTVSGMAHTFEGLSSQNGQRSMAALAGGISEVLVATESGLSVAIPALILVHLAHRQIDKREARLNRLKERVWKTAPR